jgi:hypothetical protein
MSIFDENNDENTFHCVIHLLSDRIQDDNSYFAWERRKIQNAYNFLKSHIDSADQCKIWMESI